jgi:hypothetical protein
MAQIVPEAQTFAGYDLPLEARKGFLHLPKGEPSRRFNSRTDCHHGHVSPGVIKPHCERSSSLEAVDLAFNARFRFEAYRRMIRGRANSLVETVNCFLAAFTIEAVKNFRTADA